MIHDPELTDIEGQLFALMRDEVITELRKIGDNQWQCETWVPYDKPTNFSQRAGVELQGRRHVSSSALAAYMVAFDFVMTRRLEGRPIYSRVVKGRRKKLGLD